MWIGTKNNNQLHPTCRQKWYLVLLFEDRQLSVSVIPIGWY